jgi:hypothetical protein
MDLARCSAVFQYDMVKHHITLKKAFPVQRKEMSFYSVKRPEERYVAQTHC